MTARLGIPIPEMIFGDNLVEISHLPSGWSIAFTAEAALDRVDKTGERMLRVAYAGAWSSSREKTSAEISEVVKPYDWSYTTDYQGTETPAENGERKLARGTIPIPIDLLRRRDPILFADEVVLYESELDDNGISILTVKMRVMEHRMLLLCRLYMRLDNVVVRVRDTRVYVDFGTDTVIREYTEREDSFGNVKRVSNIRPPPFSSVHLPLFSFFFSRCSSSWLTLSFFLFWAEPTHEWSLTRRHHDRLARRQPSGGPAADGGAGTRERVVGGRFIGTPGGQSLEICFV
jgi:hypothetical protein